MAKVTSAPTTTVIEQTDEQKAAKKRADFSRLAGKRMHVLLSTFKSIHSLANPSSYVWTKEQAEKIGRLIDEQAKSLKAALGDGSDAVKAAGKGKKPGRSIDI